MPSEQGFLRAGMFANQNTAANLRQQFTIEQIAKAVSYTHLTLPTKRIV